MQSRELLHSISTKHEEDFRSKSRSKNKLVNLFPKRIEVNHLFNQAILSITELTEYIKNILENDSLLQNVTVRGELSNFYRHSSGHLYFTLKDRKSQLKCVMFRNAALQVKFQPENGMNLIISGSMGIYQGRGEYQLYARIMQPDGIGALHLAFEQLKKKLEAEGLFNEAQKKPIPNLPRRIGVITSPTGAAIRDIISVITRRFPHVEILIIPSAVQGEEAPQNLVQALRQVQAEENIDVIIIGRGGGSIEDLWAFNEEIVAREIFSCQIPVISAVGHETDFTIADFVADLRAPTPSAAAELAVGNYSELVKQLDGLNHRLDQSLTGRLENYRERLENLINRPIFTRPEEIFLKSWQRVDDLERRLHQIMGHQLKLKKEQSRSFFKQLNSLSPLNVLSRGYSLTEKLDGSLIKSINDVSINDQIKISLKDGKLITIVTEQLPINKNTEN